ncbi:MAG: phosphate acyltransferase PlsX [Proteobacteria bacterium]|nr:phosphate acyltransferase PlsX [Pseudomonadota bacterium]
MENKITLSVDAMGGSDAPASVLNAISLFLQKNKDVYFLIFGNEELVIPEIEKVKLPHENYEFIATQSVVLDTDKPVHALKYARDSSMRKAIDAVSSGRAKACISSGNTGALMVMSTVSLGTLNGIKRPAISGIFPGNKKPVVILDIGANSECNEIMLFQFALMGICFAKVVLGIEDPNIGLLSTGEEELKGRDIDKKTHALLKESGLNFVGYVEGHDIAQNKADVVVMDGFSGNIILKMAEGVASMILNHIKLAMKEGGFLAKIGAMLIARNIKKKLKFINPNSHNGAMFIGLNGIVIKSHGSATVHGMQNAINVAFSLASKDVNKHIISELRTFEKNGIGMNIVDKIYHTSAKILGINK